MKKTNVENVHLLFHYYVTGHIPLFKNIPPQ